MFIHSARIGARRLANASTLPLTGECIRFFPLTEAAVVIMSTHVTEKLRKTSLIELNLHG